MTIKGTQFVRVNMMAQSIANNANAAYWLECAEHTTHYRAAEMDEKFRDLADSLGYVVAPKVEIAA